jgi:hypothetical protein
MTNDGLCIQEKYVYSMFEYVDVDDVVVAYDNHL